MHTFCYCDSQQHRQNRNQKKRNLLIEIQISGQLAKSQEEQSLGLELMPVIGFSTYVLMRPKLHT